MKRFGPFWTKRRILGRKREAWILENLRNFEYEDHGRKKRTKKTVEFDDIKYCRISGHDAQRERKPMTVLMAK